MLGEHDVSAFQRLLGLLAEPLGDVVLRLRVNTQRPVIDAGQIARGGRQQRANMLLRLAGIGGRLQGARRRRVFRLPGLEDGAGAGAGSGFSGGFGGAARGSLPAAGASRLDGAGATTGGAVLAMIGSLSRTMTRPRRRGSLEHRTVRLRT